MFLKHSDSLCNEAQGTVEEKVKIGYAMGIIKKNRR